MKKILAFALSALMAVSLVPTIAMAEPAAEGADTLVVGYSSFSNKFSPFFAESAYDQDAQAMTQLALLNGDRTGAIVTKGIEGEVRNYNGTDYTYYSAADVDITENEDGTVDYAFTLRDDLKFSDGEPVTIDDVIFSMYVLLDPTYDGASSLYAVPIEGVDAYRSGMDTLFNLLAAAGPENEDFSLWTADDQAAFWADVNQAGAAFAQEICDYCVAAGANAEEDSVAAKAANWGFELAEDATVDDFFATMVEAYGGDLVSLSNTETAGSSLFDLMENYGAYTTGIATGDSVPNVSGITKIDDYHMNVKLTQVDATAIYQFSLYVSPLHYYGDKALYDYDNNMFGFPKGDLSLVRAKTTQPMGAGAYKFIKFENGVINFEANEEYYLGEPNIKYINFQECLSDDDKLNGVTTGTIDIADPSFSNDTVEAIKAANGGEVNGDKVVTNTVDNLGYGYIGMNAKVLNVAGERGSEASKNLRKAFGTIFSVYRNVSIDSYYGDRASVINYPISNTSWAAPQSTDDGYCVAFSKDVNGNEIYTSDMDAEARYAAAIQASLGFFEAAGYTVEDGKLVAAPEGASLEYEAWIPADGSGDHPSFMILTEASNALATIGMNLKVKDLTNSADLWTALEAQEVAIWCAAWQATVDPDMFQIYYSDIANGELNPGGSNYQYAIADPQLDELILEARTSSDQTYRKSMYKACLDIIIDWAVEIPVYQRQNAIIFSAERVDTDSITPDITTFYGWMAEIENTKMK